MYQHVSPICTNNIPINQHVRKVSPIYTNDIPMNQYVRYVSPIYTNDIPMNQLVRLFQRVLDETGTLQRSERGASSMIKSVTKVVRMMTRKGREDTQQLLFETKLSLNLRFRTRFLDKIKSKHQGWAKIQSWFHISEQMFSPHERLVLMVVFDTGPVWHCSEKKYRKYLRWYHRKILR